MLMVLLMVLLKLMLLLLVPNMPLPSVTLTPVSRRIHMRRAAMKAVGSTPRSPDAASLPIPHLLRRCNGCTPHLGVVGVLVVTVTVTVLAMTVAFLAKKYVFTPLLLLLLLLLLLSLLLLLLLLLAKHSLRSMALLDRKRQRAGAAAAASHPEIISTGSSNNVPMVPPRNLQRPYLAVERVGRGGRRRRAHSRRPQPRA